jgi:hypothetical protein
MSENFTKNLPPEFVRNVVGVCGETGARWLHDLPRIVAEIAAEWSLEVRVHFPNLSYNFAAPCVCKNGCEAVLKIGFPETVPVIFGEAAFLRAADGDGTVRLLQFDRERRALLLERLSPGEELKRVCETDDERATRIAVKLLKRIHSRMRLTDGFPSLESWTDGFRKAAKPHFAASFVEKARVYFIELGAASDGFCTGIFIIKIFYQRVVVSFWRLTPKQSSATSVTKSPFSSTIREAGFCRARIGWRWRSGVSRFSPKHLPSSRKIYENGLMLKRFCRRGGRLKTAEAARKNGWRARKSGKIKKIWKMHSLE